jgi:hypothetical protein
VQGSEAAVVDASHRFETAADLDVEEAEDGLVVYDPAADTVHHLNKTAAIIFGLCDGTRAAPAIADELARLFSLDEPPLPETLDCLDELSQKGLVS